MKFLVEEMTHSLPSIAPMGLVQINVQLIPTVLNQINLSISKSLIFMFSIWILSFFCISWLERRWHIWLFFASFTRQRLSNKVGRQEEDYVGKIRLWVDSFVSLEWFYIGKFKIKPQIWFDQRPALHFLKIILSKDLSDKVNVVY